MSDIINPLLERATIPGETFTLPSLGLFYNNGELADDVSNGEIYILPMITKDELFMKSPDLLYSGEAINRILKRCAPSILKPLELISRDVDYILTALRKVSFGEHSEFVYTHDCKKAKEHTYIININDYLRSTKKIDPTNIERDHIKTLSNGQIIKIQPPRFLETLHIYQTSTMSTDDINYDDLEDKVLSSIASMLQQVDDVTDKKMIIEWLKVLPPLYIKEIRDYVIALSEWGITFDTKIKCNDCGKIMDLKNELNIIRFFLT